jgi:hypothetical protein
MQETGSPVSHAVTRPPVNIYVHLSHGLHHHRHGNQRRLSSHQAGGGTGTPARTPRAAHCEAAGSKVAAAGEVADEVCESVTFRVSSIKAADFN